MKLSEANEYLSQSLLIAHYPMHSRLRLSQRLGNIKPPVPAAVVPNGANGDVIKETDRYPRSRIAVFIMNVPSPSDSMIEIVYHTIRQITSPRFSVRRTTKKTCVRIKVHAEDILFLCQSMNNQSYFDVQVSANPAAISVCAVCFVVRTMARTWCEHGANAQKRGAFYTIHVRFVRFRVPTKNASNPHG